MSWASTNLRFFVALIKDTCPMASVVKIKFPSPYLEDVKYKDFPYMFRDHRSTTPSASQEAIQGPVSSNDSVA